MDLWNQTIEYLRQSISHVALSTWFSDCEYVTTSGSEFVISTDGEFKKMMIETNFAERIETILSTLSGKKYRLVVLAGAQESMNYLAEKRKRSELPSLISKSQFVFSRFLTGESNEFAYKASLAVAQNPGKQAFNPLFLYGKPGVGKTHLLYSIGQYYRDKNPGKHIIYIKGDDFTNCLVRAIREKKTEDFRDKFRRCDLLLMDDIQCIAGRKATQEEFFNTFNELYMAGTQMVFAANMLPLEMSMLDDRLRSRLEGGLVVEIESPDVLLRRNILREKAADMKIQLTERDIAYLADRLTLNVRQLEGAVKNVCAYSRIMGEIPSMVLDRALSNLISLDTEPANEKMTAIM